MFELPDLNEQIESMSCALYEAPNDDTNFPLFLGLLGSLYGARFDLLGELDDINKAIEYTSIALTLTADDEPSMPYLLDTQGVYYSKRFHRLGVDDDIEKAIEHANLAIALTPKDDGCLSDRLSNLVGSYNYRFQRLGRLDDLEKAIGCGIRAVHLAPEGHPELPAQLTNLGASYGYRFQRLGNLNDLEQAINCGSCAVALTPEEDPDLSSRLANLGLSHKMRFERLGELDDLEKAIEYESSAVSSTPDGHPSLSSRLGNLGVSYRFRFRRLGGLDDLEKAIEYESRAVALTPSNHPILSTRLANLGGSHILRFQLLGEPDDLDRTIECEARAVALTPDDHLHMPTRLANLGASYGHRYRQTSERRDMEKALTYQSRALALTPDGHPSLPLQYDTFADLSFLIYQRTSDRSHLQNSLDSFRKASRTSPGAPRERFRYAYKWAELALQHSALNCIEAYQTTIDLLTQFIWLGATTDQRYKDLSTAETLAGTAALAAIRSGDCALALEWLEHARCVVWNQSLMLRSPLGQLHSSCPELASRLQTVSDQLHRAGAESRESQTVASDSSFPEEEAQKHRRLAQEYDILLSQARGLPGFENFLQPTKASDLLRAARYGPVVVINCHTERCDALLILPGQENVNHIPLPNFTKEKAEQARFEMVRSKRLRDRGVRMKPEPGEKDKFSSILAVLWDAIVKPILDFLGYTNNVLDGKLPHIIWCPTGVLSFLPLHAAGDYDKPRSKVFDYVISSYTPTLTALLTSTPRSLSSDSRVLAIGLETTPGHSRLPGTAEELGYVKGHVQNMVDYSELVNNQATTTAVLDAMEQHDWVHLACHAHQNLKDPTRSGFFLYEGTLDLATINRRSFKSKGLAFLSACQTATGDEKLPDEAIHLASGMLMAGYTSVIATMWSVADADAPFVADKIYGQLMKDANVGNGEAGEALHGAVAELRARIGEKAFERWVPYIHFGA